MVLCSFSEGSYGRCWSQEVGIPSGISLLPFHANLPLLGRARSNQLIALLPLYWNIISGVLKCIYLPSNIFIEETTSIWTCRELSATALLSCSASWIGS